MNTYRVHQFGIDMKKDRDRLEMFLNSLKGEIVSIIPGVSPKFQLMGATAETNFLFIVEKI